MGNNTSYHRNTTYCSPTFISNVPNGWNTNFAIDKTTNKIYYVSSQLENVDELLRSNLEIKNPVGYIPILSIEIDKAGTYYISYLYRDEYNMLSITPLESGKYVKSNNGHSTRIATLTNRNFELQGHPEFDKLAKLFSAP